MWRWLSRVALSGLTFLFMVAICEISLRIMIPGSTADLFITTGRSDLPKVMKPSYEGLVYGVPLVTNELGFRDRQDDVPERKPSELLLGVVGDSFTVSAGVPFEDLATTRLQEGLTQALRRHVRVLNLGCAGYALPEYERVVEEAALKLQVDHVLLFLFPSNDFDLTLYRDNQRIAANQRADTEIDERHMISVSDLYVVRATLPGIVAILRSTPLRRVTKSGKPFGPGVPDWDTSAAALARVSRLMRERNVELTAIVLPSTFDFAQQRPHHEIVTNLCSEISVDCFDALPAFQRTGKRPLSYRLNLIDGHPNSAYHDVLYQFVLDVLIERIGKAGLPPSP